MTTEENDNGWTLKTLERYLTSKIDNLSKVISTRVDTDSRALQAALEGLERRLEGMNEFRATLQDQRIADEKDRARFADSFLTKDLYAVEHRNLEMIVQKAIERITELDKKLFALSELKADKREGISARYMNGAIIFAGLSFLVSLIGMAWGLFHR